MAAAAASGSGRGRGSAAAATSVVAALLCVAAALQLLASAPAAEARKYQHLPAGTTHLVGSDKGWTHGVDYAQWAAGQTFRVGDVLVFNYTAEFHNVAWVSKHGYRKCVVSPAGGAPVFTTGYEALRLPGVGTHYFICAKPHHCSEGGMKLAVTVAY